MARFLTAQAHDGKAVTTTRSLLVIGNGASDTDSVFGMSAHTIARRAKAAAQAAGLQGSFSGHSRRVGLAQRLAQGGAPMNVIMTAGRWSSSSTIARYTKNIDAGESLRYLK